MYFEKWQALGNDYLIVETGAVGFELTPARVRALCAAHTGVFADGVLLLSAATVPDCVARLRIFNPDGSEAALSGNGAREAALYLHRRGRASSDTFAIETAAGAIHPTITSATTARMLLGRALVRSEDHPSGSEDGTGILHADGREWSYRHLQVGNPQCTIRMHDVHALQELDLDALGPGIERHELFPNRTNVSWYAALGEDRIRARIFERGVGETSASGTGAVGAAVAHVLDGGVSPVTVALDGGDLEVEVSPELDVTLSGWAVPVFAGTLSHELVRELHETE
ncbi:MAG: diaminopimelate epimerase [Solirubrobacteraceae bacterium]